MKIYCPICGGAEEVVVKLTQVLPVHNSNERVYGLRASAEISQVKHTCNIQDAL